MGGVLSEANIKQGLTCRSNLLEAAAELGKYLYLAKTSDLSEIISFADNTATIEKIGGSTLTTSQQRQSAIRDVILANPPQSKEDVEAAAADQNSETGAAGSVTLPEIKNSAFASSKVVVFSEGDFDPSLNAGLSATQEFGTNSSPESRKRSEITHVCVTDTAQTNNFSSRGAEYVAIFSNLIPSVELSKCVPYFNIKFIQNVPMDGTVKMPFLTLESFLGAIKVDTGIKGQGAGTPYGIKANPVDMPTSKLGTTVTGIELFQAPQTLVRPGIDILNSYTTNRGIRVLDAMQPLASIESVNFDVSALSQNFMTTNTRIDMTIVLHDKSRLAELSPLITPGVYPTIKAEVEWGWSHPDTNNFTNNRYGKFLNALRSKQVFCVNSATFSNKDATSLSIKLQLTGLGEYISSNTSIYTGDYVSYELIRAKMNQLFTIIQETSKDGKQTKQVFVGTTEQPVALSNWETSDKWVQYRDFRAIADLIDRVQNGSSKITELVDKYRSILTGISTQDSTDPSIPRNMSVYLQDELRSTIVSSSIEQSPYLKTYGSTEGEKPSSVTSYLRNIEEQMALDSGNTDAKGNPVPLQTVTFGDCVYRYFSVPMSLTDTYDEIRVTTFDFNDHAGKMAGFNIGAFPILAADVASALLKPKMTSQKAMQQLIKIVSDPSATQYGVKQAYVAKAEAEKRAAEAEENEDDALAEELRDLAQREFDKTMTQIYTNKAADGLAVSFEPKFLTPRIKMHTEVAPVKSGDTFKQILNVFIYDEANSGYRGVNLLTSIMQQPGGATNIITRGKDTAAASVDGKSAVIAERDEKTNTYTVTVDRERAKRIVTGAIPTLRIGSEGSLITNASYNTSAGGDLANLNLLRGMKNSGGASAAGSFPGIDADLFVIPATLSLTLPGMPLINRGQTYFVDFGTGTTLDNTYTVMTVKHSMRLGSFTTTVTLNVTNQGSIKSVASKLQTDLKQLEIYSNSQLPSAVSTQNSRTT